MPKWADYLISEVQYDFKHMEIINVKRHLDTEDGIALPNIVHRNLIVDDLLDGKSYKTIFKTIEGKWVEGKDIQIIKSTGFITTDPNSKTRDYLENLPEF